ncbi:TonB-dependent siderophore receptor [Motiliproteus sp. MSK22-1]|uniref:TonB-dependent receptor plug domain-containing protein n=1 Tax=Motiliproteus sp. MSK22-1 TaxID=1897630 RepID=UPI000976948E|nr:TonB-dependent receptor [Motiliproteus sp. MSK22-1]OMH38258.1 hypothetical protein BGP75_08395 [Motiliproteus sp. MSK22-1]
MNIRRYSLTLFALFAPILSLPAHTALTDATATSVNDFDDGEINEFEEGDELGDFYSGEELVSIATGTSTPLNKAPAVASVITRKQIEAMGATHLDEVLERVPGIHVSPSKLSRLDSVFSIRGLQTGVNPQVLVLLNGVEFKYVFNGGLPDSFRMPISNIKRIEVIRGPGSAVYGADAYSGVINIITNTASDNKTGDVGIRTGSFDSQDVWFRKGYEKDDFSVSFAFENQTSDGDSGRVINSDQQSAFDGLFGTSASLAPGPLNTNYDVTNIHLDFGYGNWKLENWYWQQDSGGLGPGVAQALDNVGYQNTNLFRTKLGFQDQVTSNWNLKAGMSYQKTEIDASFVLFPAGATLPIGSDGNAFSGIPVGPVTFTDGYIGNPGSTDQTFKAEIAGIYSGINDHQIRAATGWTRQEIETREHKNFGPGVIDGTVSVIDGTLTDVTGTEDIYLTDQDRTNYYLSLQDEWQLNNDWSLTAGVRWDHFSDFGNSSNPRIALVWETSHNLTSKLLYGTAFRAPAFNEQYLINNPSALGNPDLTPEEIETVELAFDYRPTFDTSVQLSFFYYEATDLIDTVVVPGTSSKQTENNRDQEGHGAEIEFGWKISDHLKLYANYAYQHSEDSTTGADIPDAPQHSTYLDLQYTVTPQLSTSLQHYWVGSRPRASGDTREEIDDYHWVNMKLKYILENNKLQLALIAKNLLNTNASEPSSGSIPDDFPLESRSIWGQVSYRF